MNGYHKDLTGLIQLTEEIHNQAKGIRLKMEENDAEQLEALQRILEKRGEAIQKLDTCMQQKKIQWTNEDKEIITQLKEYEQKLQPLMNGLHQSFLSQMNSISQKKQVSQKYIGAYQNTTTEGSFIDKRK